MALTRSNRIALAEDTLTILERGKYIAPSGTTVSLDIASCLAATRLFLPDELTRLHKTNQSKGNRFATRFEVRNETTLQGAAELAQRTHGESIGVLNFASAKNPGGGFLNGSQAQEESLARSSGLYLSLREAPDFYDAHRASSSLLYSDRIILSPNCSVFRNDDGTLLETPYAVTFLTCAAPNAGAIADQDRTEEASRIADTLTVRAAKVLALAALEGLENLVLGAWGCGVFRNDPKQVAETFASHLLSGGAHFGCFQTVRFSIWNPQPPFSILEPFQRLFA